MAHPRQAPRPAPSLLVVVTLVTALLATRVTGQLTELSVFATGLAWKYNPAVLASLSGEPTHGAGVRAEQRQCR